MNPLYWMLLAHSPLKPQERLEVIKHAKKTSGSLEAFVEQDLPNLEGELALKLRDALAQASTTALLLEELRSQGIQVLAVTDPSYPRLLKDSLKGKTPLVLYVLGEPKVLGLASGLSLAIIGSRQASAEALKWARRAGAHFGLEGYTVVTGMARGIDLEAAEGALEAGGRVVGVLPYGLLMSKEVRPLVKRYQEYIFGGRLTLVSDLFPKASWKAAWAMARNRIVVGLAHGILVVESGLKETEGKNGKKRLSGTWNAVERAKELGKPVFVLNLSAPGNRSLVEEGLGLAVALKEPWETFAFIEDELYARTQGSHAGEVPGSGVEGGKGEGQKGSVVQPKLLD
jgi:predicted Rossmann fold nucleotide-binding protein DprA/Smf involved in DNA uptake